MQLPNLPSLNRSETRQLMTRNQKFPVDCTGTHKEAVLGFKYVPQKVENGKKTNAHFLATVKIVESDRVDAEVRGCRARAVYRCLREAGPGRSGLRL
jgi:hypothetical protein